MQNQIDKIAACQAMRDSLILLLLLFVLLQAFQVLQGPGASMEAWSIEACWRLCLPFGGPGVGPLEVPVDHCCLPAPQRLRPPRPRAPPPPPRPPRPLLVGAAVVDGASVVAAQLKP